MGLMQIWLKPKPKPKDAAPVTPIKRPKRKTEVKPDGVNINGNGDPGASPGG